MSAGGPVARRMRSCGTRGPGGGRRAGPAMPLSTPLLDAAFDSALALVGSASLQASRLWRERETGERKRESGLLSEGLNPLRERVSLSLSLSSLSLSVWRSDQQPPAGMQRLSTPPHLRGALHSFPFCTSVASSKATIYHLVSQAGWDRCNLIYLSCRSAVLPPCLQARGENKGWQQTLGSFCRYLCLHVSRFNVFITLSPEACRLHASALLCPHESTVLSIGFGPAP